MKQQSSEMKRRSRGFKPPSRGFKRRNSEFSWGRSLDKLLINYLYIFYTQWRKKFQYF